MSRTTKGKFDFRLATERQKAYMDSVGIQYDNPTIQEASKLITEYQEQNQDERHTMDLED